MTKSLEVPRPGQAPRSERDSSLSGAPIGLPRPFPDRLRQLRRTAGLSQTELAGGDLSPSYVSLLETGKRTPSREVAAQLAARLGCSVTMLVDGEPSERERRIELELTYCQLALNHGETHSARERLDALLADTSLDRRVRDDATVLLASALDKESDPGRAADLLLPVFQRARQGTSHLPLLAVGVSLCGYYLMSGDFHRIVVIGEQALESAQERQLIGSDDYFRLAATLMWAYHEVGDLVHASTFAESLIDQAEKAGSPSGQAAIYWNASLVAHTLGRIDEALFLSQRALAKLTEQGNTRDLARLKSAAAELLLAAQPARADEALALLATSADLLSDLGSRIDLGEWEAIAALAKLHVGEYQAAHELATSAAARFTGADATRQASAQFLVGDTLGAIGDAEGAIGHYRGALALLAASGEKGRAAARAWREVGDRLAAAGVTREAVRAYQKALDALSLSSRFEPVHETIERAATLRVASPEAAGVATT